MAPPAPPPLPPPSEAVAKAMARLQAALAEDAAYEGQQIAKTVSARLRARGGEGGAADALDLLERAAEAQLGAGQITCGAELASMVLDALPPSDFDAGAARVLRLLASFGGAPPADAQQAASLATEAARFAAGALKWARAAAGGSPNAAAKMAAMHGACGAAVGGAAATGAGGGPAGARAALAAAGPFWARARDPPAFAAAVASAAATGPPGEAGAFAARAVLQTIAAGGPGGDDPAGAAADGAALAGALKRGAAAEGGSAAADPLSHFPTLFAEAAVRRSPALAALAVREYGPALARDAGGLQALAEEAAAGCGQSAAGGGGGGGGMGGLGGLMRMLGGGGGP